MPKPFLASCCKLSYMNKTTRN